MSYAYKDPLIRRSDDWRFPLHKYATIGELGLVHRGTPWQTVYLKSFPANEAPANWMRWSGHVGTHPTNDWRFLQLFTTALNDNAARGLLAVNQTNQASWSAVLSGVSVLSNTVSGNVGQTAATSNLVVQIEPASPQMQKIVESINAAHALYFSTTNGTSFPYLGAVLSASALTVDSPYLNVTGRLRQNSISDSMYERIPMQILSLLKEDEPRVAIYAFGQSLKPAENSQLVSGEMRGMVTNYQVTGEYAVKALIRFDNAPRQPKAVVENFSLLPAD
jgi:hypothetical protein